MSLSEFENAPQKLVGIDPEFHGLHDIAVLFHVDEIPNDLLSLPGDFFEQSMDEDVELHVPCRGWRRRRGMRELGLASSGGKNKVLRRLKLHYQVLEKQMTSEAARKMFAEQERDPEVPRAPALPSPRQQGLHSVTHQPFAPWCQACVIERSRQSPRSQKPEKEPDKDAASSNVPVIQVDYCYTFTRSRSEGDEEGQDESGGAKPAQMEEDRESEPDDRDQFGLCLVATESSTGWIACVPLLQKGAASLKRTTEQLVRLSLQVTAANSVLIQGDTEPSIRQVVNSVLACRAKLGLATQSRLTSKTGLMPPMARRRNSLTLRSHLEDRIKAKVEGHCHVYAWLMRRSSAIDSLWQREEPHRLRSCSASAIKVTSCILAKCASSISLHATKDIVEFGLV